MNIRLASPDDRETLIELYLALLESNDKYGLEILPTRRNAEHFVDNVFLPAAEQGDPVLIAWDGEMAAGALFWICNRSGLDTRHKSAHGYGTYVAEDASESGVGEILEKVGVEMLREAGCEQIMESAQSADSKRAKALRKFGYEPATMLYRLEIEKVPPYSPPS